jgi:hypothetical protein
MTTRGRSASGHQSTYVLDRRLAWRKALCTSWGSTRLVMSVVAKKSRREWNVPSAGHRAASRHPRHMSDHRWL